MGLGGYLTWTAAVREIKSRNKSFKIVPVETRGNVITRVVQSPVFDNNPAITYDINHENKFFLELNNSRQNYCKQDTPDRAIHRYDKHIIQQICEYYEIYNPELKCELFLRDEEKDKALDISKQLSTSFVLIEPHSKTNYTTNRTYPFEKWQKVVNEISKDIEVAQIGVKGAKILKNVKDLTGLTTFREATALIGLSKVLISSEGGLTHAATATKTPAMVVITGYQSPRMVCYPQNINLNIASHGPCGLKSPCKDCQKDAENHDYTQIVDKIRRGLG